MNRNMKHKKEIHKFLNFEMSSEEKETFKGSSEYKEKVDVLELFEGIKAIPFNEDLVLNSIRTNKHKMPTNNKKEILLYKKWIPTTIAASILLLISISLFYFNSINRIDHTTTVGNIIQFSLPDASNVWLNAKSEIAHNKDWEKSRNISLKGEAYFEVAKGKKFTVKTSEGIVTVLGTKFNVKQRANFFEVHCYEGKVAVTYKNKETILFANDVFSSNILTKAPENTTKPNWIQNKSIFNNTPLEEVLSDISLQYNIEFILDKSIDQQYIRYTGGYEYTDPLSTTLTLLCSSLKLNYTSKGKHIYLRTK